MSEELEVLEKEAILKKEIKRLAEICQIKREHLLERARVLDRKRKHFNVAAGTMALLSGGLTTAIFNDLLGGTIIKVLSAILVFGSGLISLIVTTYVDHKDIEEMYHGAGKYLMVRDRLDVALARYLTNMVQLQNAYLRAREEYAKLSPSYDRYVNILISLPPERYF